MIPEPSIRMRILGQSFGAPNAGSECDSRTCARVFCVDANRTRRKKPLRDSGAFFDVGGTTTAPVNTAVSGVAATSGEPNGFISQFHTGLKLLGSTGVFRTFVAEKNRFIPP